MNAIGKTHDLKYTKAFEDLYSLEQKIENQITRLIGNSNLNLILGTLTTLMGIIILGVSILSFKISSLKASLILEDKDSASKIFTEFSKTERNFILKKDETTEKLEIEKLESQNTRNILEKISNIISSIKK